MGDRRSRGHHDEEHFETPGQTGADEANNFDGSETGVVAESHRVTADQCGKAGADGELAGMRDDAVFHGPSTSTFRTRLKTLVYSDAQRRGWPGVIDPVRVGINGGCKHDPTPPARRFLDRQVVTDCV